MKKYAIATLALVLIGALLTGCGCTNNAVATQPATKPTTMPATVPTTEAVKPTQTPGSMPATMPLNPTEGTSPSGTESGSMPETGITETTEPMTRESGRVRSHVNGDF